MEMFNVLDRVKSINESNYKTLKEFDKNIIGTINKLCNFSDDIAEHFLKLTTQEGLITPKVLDNIYEKFFTTSIDYFCQNGECSHSDKKIKSTSILKKCPYCSSRLSLMNEEELQRTFQFYICDLKFFFLEGHNETIYLIYNNKTNNYLIKRGNSNLKDYLFMYMKNQNPNINLNFLKLYSNSNNAPGLILDYVSSFKLFNMVHDLGFRPVKERTFNSIDKKYFNSYFGNKYLNLEKVSEMPKGFDLKAECPHIHTLLNNLVGEKEEGLKYLINYLSFILNNPNKRTQKVLSFYGEEASGKGIFYNEILNVLYEKYAKLILQKDLDSDFNDFYSKTLIIFIDESRYNKDTEQLMLSLTTADKTIINYKNGKKVEEEIYFNFICASNKEIPMRVGDRRGVYFRSKTLGGSVKKAGEIGLKMVENIPNEIETFAKYLKSLNVEFSTINEGFDNNDKFDIMEATKTIEERFIDYMFSFETFIDFIRDVQDYEYDVDILLNKHIKEGFVEYDLLLDCYNKFRKTQGLKQMVSLNKFNWFCNRLDIDRDNHTQFKRGYNFNKKNVRWVNYGIIKEKFEGGENE